MQLCTVSNPSPSPPPPPPRWGGGGGGGGEHRSRMETEAKAKVVASDWWATFIHFLAVLAVLFLSIWRKDECNLFFHIDQGKIAGAARNWINFAPKTDATTFSVASVSILLLWSRRRNEVWVSKRELSMGNVSAVSRVKCIKVSELQYLNAAYRDSFVFAAV